MHLSWWLHRFRIADWNSYGRQPVRCLRSWSALHCRQQYWVDTGTCVLCRFLTIHILQTDFADADAYLENIQFGGHIVQASCFDDPPGASATHEFKVCVGDLDVTSFAVGASATVQLESTAGVDANPVGGAYISGRAQVCDTQGRQFPSQVRIPARFCKLACTVTHSPRLRFETVDAELHQAGE